MRYLYRLVACGVVAVVGACANLPEYSDPPIHTADVIHNIKCELQRIVYPLSDATKDKYGWLEEWNAKFSLTLKVFHTGGASGGASLVVPLNPGTFTIGFTGGLIGQATRTEEIEFSEKISDLMHANDVTTPYIREERAKKKHPTPALDCSGFDREKKLSGAIGIKDLVDRAIESKDFSDIKPTSFIYTIEFIIEEKGDLSPKFALVPVGSGKTLSADLKIDGSRKNTDTLKITFAKRSRCPVQLVGVEGTLLEGQCPQLVFNVSGEPGAKLAPSAAYVRERGVPTLPSDDQRALDNAEARSILRSLDIQ